MVQADCRKWHPEHGVARTLGRLMALAFFVAILITLAVYAYAAEKSVMDTPMDWMGLVTMMIPAIWATVGPIAIKGLTMTVNGFVGAYVPRSLQVILASIIGAIAAALAADPSVAVATAVTGGASQVYASIKPHNLHADAPPQGIAP